jgi:small subunit ribosomal protein S20
VPNIKSVKKDVVRSRARRLVNNAAKSRIKTSTKKAQTAITEKSADLSGIISTTVSIVDKAAKRGIIHKNAAARRKSRLMKRAAAVAA